MYSIRISEQVEGFLRTLPPVPKRQLKTALTRLGKELGDIKVLENELSGFSRLKVGRYRVVFCYAEPQTIDCIFVEDRKLIYELFGELLRDHLS